MLSRDEADVGGLLAAKVVEEVFVREGRILDLTLGGQVIHTTPEHPFYVQDRGWTAAGELVVGDLLSTANGHWLPLEATVDTGRVETVYNMRVADYHTYFVGSGEWGFGVWVHNRYAPGGVNLNANNAVSHFGVYEIKVNGMLYKIGKADLNRVTKSLGLPTRVHQQVRQLGKIFGEENVRVLRITNLGEVTTATAKAMEHAAILQSFRTTGFVPLGNWKSFVL